MTSPPPGARRSGPGSSGPYHEGERAVQERAGVREAADRLAVLIRPEIPGQAQAFLSVLSLVVVGAPDDDGRCWATLLSGEPGFVRATAGGVRVRARTREGDPIGIRRPGDPVGLLGLDLRTRRRYRVNGRVRTWGADAVEIYVDQAYGNCPRYIRRQDPGPPSAGRPAPAVLSGALGPEHMAQIRSSDRMFVATCHPERGADVSHKGGPAGFVEVLSAGRLRFRDFPGNNMFNTLGNLSVSPRVGLLFHDFKRRVTVQVTGEGRVEYGTGDTRRVDVTVMRVARAA